MCNLLSSLGSICLILDYLILGLEAWDSCQDQHCLDTITTGSCFVQRQESEHWENRWKNKTKS